MNDASLAVVLWVVVAGYAVVVAGWWARHIFISLMRPLDLVADPIDADGAPACVSLVIPARNERERIGACLQSVLAPGSRVAEVIVVDDRSDDGTSDVVAEYAQGTVTDPLTASVRVVRVDHLPPGWSGKAHACHVGAASATGDWLLFTDADCRFFPGGIAGALEHAERHSVDLLTLWPRADHRSFWEHLLIPLCGALIGYWFANLRVNNPKSSIAFANGQFILMRREAYERIGGHVCARDAVIEDIPLARHAKRNGLRIRSVLGRDIFTVRMYTGFAEIRDGWTRIFIGALQRRWKLLASVWSLLGGSLFPCLAGPILAIMCLSSGLPADRAHATLVVLVWLHLVGVMTVSYRFWGLGCCNRWYLVLYPVSVLLVMWLFLRAWWWMFTKRRIMWRGSVTGPARPDQPCRVGSVPQDNI